MPYGTFLHLTYAFGKLDNPEAFAEKKRSDKVDIEAFNSNLRKVNG